MTPKEIFLTNQVLTIDIAKDLIGKKIAVTNPEYKYNTPDVRTFILKGLKSEWEMETPERQEYIKSIGKEEKFKNRIKLEYEGDNPWATCEIGNYCLPEGTFHGSDADREIYYVVLD